MGCVIGGGSSINVMVYVCGYKSDYDYWVVEVGDVVWNYDYVLVIYKCIEDWQGIFDLVYCGQGGNVWVQLVKDFNFIVLVMKCVVVVIGIFFFEDYNGVMMEGFGGCVIVNIFIKDGCCCNMVLYYFYLVMQCKNFIVLI